MSGRPRRINWNWPLGPLGDVAALLGTSACIGILWWACDFAAWWVRHP